MGVAHACCCSRYNLKARHASFALAEVVAEPVVPCTLRRESISFVAPRSRAQRDQPPPAEYVLRL